MTRLQENLIAAALILVACLRVVSTYSEFNGTFDEAAHVAAGMEVLQYHQYTYEYQHPPLPRVASAIGPYLAGRRLPLHREPLPADLNVLYQDGSDVLYSGDAYSKNLALARLGMLPFFVLLCWVTYSWARMLMSGSGPLWSVALVTSTPVLLGHGAFAALDVAGAAGALTAFYCLHLWVRTPSTRTSLFLGAAVAFAMVTKLSNVAFVPVGFGAALACVSWRDRRRPQWHQVAIVLSAAFFLMWACYGFTIKSLESQWGPHPSIDKALEGIPVAKSVFDAALRAPLPLTEWMLGVRDVYRHGTVGHDSYLFGEYSRFGWWYFFLVVILLKTPIGLLTLGAAGTWLFLKLRSDKTWPGLILITILAFLTTARVNSGARHALVLFPLMAICGGYVLSAARGRWRMAAIVLAVSVFVESALAHPDYQTYFNQFALGHPERILAESDLDWGQDLDRLARRLKELNAPSVSIRYFGSALLHKSGIPPYRELDPYQPTTGWIAISAHHFYLEHAENGSYDWLHRYQPRERIGKSIDLFYIPE